MAGIVTRVLPSDCSKQEMCLGNKVCRSFFKRKQDGDLILFLTSERSKVIRTELQEQVDGPRESKVSN